MTRTAQFTFGLTIDQYTRTVHTEDGPYPQQVELWLVGASRANGQNYVLDGAAFDDEASAQAALNAVTHDPDAKPDAWREVDPTYGSEAWGPEAEYELACFEADCYNEPRPQWGF